MLSSRRHLTNLALKFIGSCQSVFLEVANRSFLKSHALYKTIDNRKTLEQQNALIVKRLDESLAARNKLYEANRKHHLELCAMKQQIKGLEEEKAKLLLRLIMRAASTLLASTCGGSLNSLMKSMNWVYQSSSIISTSLTVARASVSVTCWLCTLTDG